MDRMTFHMSKAVIGDVLVHTLNIIKRKAVIMLKSLSNQIADLKPNILCRTHGSNIRMLKQIPRKKLKLKQDKLSCAKLIPVNHFGPEFLIKWFVSEYNPIAVFPVGLHDFSKVSNPVWHPDDIKNSFRTKWPDLHKIGIVMISRVRHIPRKIF